MYLLVEIRNVKSDFNIDEIYEIRENITCSKSLVCIGDEVCRRYLNIDVGEYTKLIHDGYIHDVSRTDGVLVDLEIQEIKEI